MEWRSFSVLTNDNNNNDTVNIKLPGPECNNKAMQLHATLPALLRISVWSSGLSIVGGNDRPTVEKLKEGEMKTV